jgi:DNA mismatch endonuclease (patch repair protein)
MSRTRATGSPEELNKRLLRTASPKTVSRKQDAEKRRHHLYPTIRVRSGQLQSAKAPQFKGLKPSSRVASLSKKKNPSTGTLPEVMLRRALSGLRARYRLHAADLPGKPDIVFRRAKVAVFVDGDFWHGRQWQHRKARLTVGSNSAYWVGKIGANRRRDSIYNRLLKKAGWVVIRVWETDLKGNPEPAARTITNIVEDRLKKVYSRAQHSR